MEAYPNYVLVDCQVFRKVSDTTLRKINPVLMANGYYTITMTNTEGKQKKEYHHRLIAKAHLPNPENKKTVNHIDGNKANNSLNNLEWATDKEQRDNTYIQRKVKKQGVRVEIWIDSKVSQTFPSVLEASRVLGIDRDTIYNVAEKDLLFNDLPCPTLPPIRFKRLGRFKCEVWNKDNTERLYEFKTMTECEATLGVLRWTIANESKKGTIYNSKPCPNLPPFKIKIY